MGYRTGFTALAMLLTGMGVAYGADQPAALVLDYSGAANPKLSAYSELPDGTELTLPAGSKLTILHYRSCKQVTITGGKITVGVPKLVVEGGQKTEEPGEQCPQEIKVATAGVSGGVLMRSVSVFTLPAKADCAVVGARRAEVTDVEITGPATPVKLALAGGRTALPQGASPLALGGDYTLHVAGRGGSELKSIPVSVIEEGDGKLCLIRVD